MNRIFVAPLLIFFNTSCNEPRRVYNDSASIPEDSAVYKLSEQLKRQTIDQSPRATSESQELSQNISPNATAAVVNAQPQAKADPQGCDDPTGVSCSPSQFSDRDTSWADPLEERIREALATVPNVSKANFISVRCGRTSCEATGRIYQQIPDFSKEESFAYLEEKMFSEHLGDANAIPVEIRVVRTSGDFTVIFERVRS